MKPIFTAVSLAFFAASAASAQTFDLSWYTIDGGGGTFSTGGAFELGGTIGQPDAGAMTGGSFSLVGGFWGGALSSGTPAPNLIGAVSRKSCDLPLRMSGPVRTSEPRQGGVTQICFTYDAAAPSAIVTVVEDLSCPSPPTYGIYSGAAVVSCTPTGNELCCTFTPALENARAYRLSIPSGTGTGMVELRGLLGDVDSSGRTNGADRSAVVSVWTGAGNFSCDTDLNNDGRTNGADRSLVVVSWTGGQNCAP